MTEKSPQTYVIWSIEHTAWWRPARCGYTRDLAEAGRYTHGEARVILERANFVAFNECLIPEECVHLDAGRLALRSVLGAIREQSSLTPEDRIRLDAIDAAAANLDQPQTVTQLHAYYGDLDRANRTPRALMYFHIGLLVSAWNGFGGPME